MQSGIKNKTVIVENVSHRYATQWAIKDINIQLEKRGITGLLGSNGAGKSTLMNIMCGTLDQSKGKVLINGIDLREHPREAKKHLGFLPQKPPLHMDLTVDEYLVHCARLRLIPQNKVKEAVDVAKTKCGITHFSKRLLKNLSGGYQQRVGIAQAIVHRPGFVVLDEPTNGLDPNQILEVRYLIKNIAVDCKVLISTHILSEVEAICNDIIMMEHGAIVFNGSLYDFHSKLHSNYIIVIMKEAPDIIELQNIPGVISVEPLDKHGAFRFQFSNLESAAERIIEKSFIGKWRLEQIAPEKVSMDKIFAELSKKTFEY